MIVNLFSGHTNCTYINSTGEHDAVCLHDYFSNMVDLTKSTRILERILNLKFWSNLIDGMITHIFSLVDRHESNGVKGNSRSNKALIGLVTRRENC